MSRLTGLCLAVLALICAAPAARAQSFGCEETYKIDDILAAPYRYGPPPPPPVAPLPAVAAEPAIPASQPARALRYAQMALRHRVTGLASYYSSFFDGRKTANGETYHNAEFTAAHLTLPLGCWIEVTSKATGRKLQVRVNDRGPYTDKFVLDLSRAAAHYLGVDMAADRRVDFRIIAMPGETPEHTDSASSKATAAGDDPEQQAARR
jgi:rare lipoprotein A (peptidoglycan hydrolase)